MKPEEPIVFAKPFIAAEEEEAVLRVLRSGWLTTGAETLAFEKEFAAFLAEPFPERPLFALALNSATAGLHLALEALGIGPGDTVLLPSLTFAATAEVVRYLGADPVFVDVAPGTFHMGSAALEETLARLPAGRAKAVIPVHYGGLPRDLPEILRIARARGLKVVEDSAHAFPSLTADGKTFAGTAGDVGVFSFYATKTITTGEGGMAVTADPALAERIALMRLHGIDRGVWGRYSAVGSGWRYRILEAGFKYNMPDLLAALGRVQLSRAGTLLAMRREIAAAYDRAFAADDRFLIPPTGPGDARHLYPLRLAPPLASCRDGFIEALAARGIGASVHFIPLHTMPYYRGRYALSDADFPETMKTFLAEISLPIWPGMTEAQVERVIGAVSGACPEGE
ncbi:MAG: DegT/DnrJ/EryC1/StrS family aminotransferase [Treponema sp.]|nr:DegT/DnrJ/EryC1/StrS family aminotransferase [Treponema sp.]